MMSVDNTQISDIATLLSRLRRRSVVIVGLMGAGKTVIGRRVATSLGLPFIDSDHEIETVSRMSVPELFENYGEDEFRALERRVIKRLLKHGPQVLSTGGGAFMNPEIREAIVRRAVSVWLKADLDTLMDRVAKRQNRPLLNAQDPRGIMQRLMDTRHPVYGEADMTIQSRDEPKEVIAGEVVAALAAYLEEEECNTKRAR